MNAPATETGVTLAVPDSDNAVHAAIHAYWNARRGDRPMPKRSEMRPSDLKAHLGWLSILEALPGYDDFRYRLLGSRVTAYFGSDGTGYTLRQIYGLTSVKPERLDDLVRLHRTVCQHAVPMRLRGEAGVWGGRRHPKFDSLYLPLANDSDEAMLILMAFTFDWSSYRRDSEAIGLGQVS